CTVDAPIAATVLTVYRRAGEWARPGQPILTLAAKQAAQLRDLVYQSYKVGGSTFLEVQSSSLKSLQANLALAITETQMLIELADLAALTDSTR
ncbi:MAG TPA: hypothetical protein VNZ67_05240, partial [bacterium]|nr:hypothetical protein [bacterium]